MTDSLNNCLHLSLKQKQILDSCITEKYAQIEQKGVVACNTAITGIVANFKMRQHCAKWHWNNNIQDSEFFPPFDFSVVFQPGEV